MVTCIQCGTELEAGETTCGRCGATSPTRAAAEPEAGSNGPSSTGHASVERPSAARASGASAEEAAPAETEGRPSSEIAVPAGTWSEEQSLDDDPDEHAEGMRRGNDGPADEARRSDRPVLRFDDTRPQADHRPEVEALRPERVFRDPDLTPVPGLALAIAKPPETHGRSAEATGTQRAVDPHRESSAERMGELVPFRKATTQPAAASQDTSAGNGRAVEPSGAVEPAGAGEDAGTAERRPEAQPAAGDTGDGEGPSTPSIPPVDLDTHEARPTPPPAEPERSEPRPPPVLASESLREDIAPTEPGRSKLRYVSVALGLVAAVGAIWLGGFEPAALLVAACAAGIVGVAVAPVRYAIRSLAVGGLSVVGLVIAAAGSQAGAVPPILASATVLLGAGLLFRGTYRASQQARWLVATGLVLAAVWFAASGAAQGLTVLDDSWQSLGSAAIRGAFVLLLLLSLLAFMESSTTAGCRVWGSLVLTWYGIHVLFGLASSIWPAAGLREEATTVGTVVRELLAPGLAASSPSGELAAYTLAGAALVPLAGLALSHLLAVAAGGTQERRRADAEAEARAHAQAKARLEHEQKTKADESR